MLQLTCLQSLLAAARILLPIGAEPPEDAPRTPSSGRQGLQREADARKASTKPKRTAGMQLGESGDLNLRVESVT